MMPMMQQFNYMMPQANSMMQQPNNHWCYPNGMMQQLKRNVTTFLMQQQASAFPMQPQQASTAFSMQSSQEGANAQQGASATYCMQPLGNNPPYRRDLTKSSINCINFPAMQRIWTLV